MASQQQSAQFSQSVRAIMDCRWSEKTKKGYQQALEFFGWLESRDEYRCFIDTTTRELTSNFRIESLLEFCSLKKNTIKPRRKTSISHILLLEGIEVL